MQLITFAGSLNEDIFDNCFLLFTYLNISPNKWTEKAVKTFGLLVRDIRRLLSEDLPVKEVDFSGFKAALERLYGKTVDTKKGEDLEVDRDTIQDLLSYWEHKGTDLEEM